MFKVGDKVKIVAVTDESVWDVSVIGETGVIVNVDMDYIFPYEIKYDKQDLEELVQTHIIGSLFKENELEIGE